MTKYGLTNEDFNAIETRKSDLLSKDKEEIKAIVEEIFGTIPDPQSKRWSWHVDFMGSVKGQIARGSSLSPKQLYHVAKIEREIHLAPAQEVDEKKFKEIYLSTPEMRADLVTAVRYYENSGYWSKLVGEYKENKDNENWAPSKSVYDRAIAQNKFVQRLLSEVKSPRKYADGQMVTLRANASRISSKHKSPSKYDPNIMTKRVYRQGDLLMIVSYDNSDIEPKRGGKGLKVLALGTNEILSVREADIKKVKVKK